MLISELLQHRTMSLVVSLPVNSPEPARAAVEAGAHALKVHLNVAHRASGTVFGSVAEERDRLVEIGRIAGDRPLGIVPGADPSTPWSEVAEAAALGFRTISMYAHHFPAHWFHIPGVEFMAAADSTYSLAEVQAVGNLPLAILEASVIPPEGYGQPLTARDLALYSRIAAAVPVPVVVPSQKCLRPDEVGLLHGAGVRAVMIGAVVTGTTPDGVFAATEAFRKAVEAI